VRQEGRPPDLTFTVRGDEDGRRLDVYLGQHYAECSRSHFKRLILEGSVRVDELVVKPGYSVGAGERISVWLATPEDLHPLVPRAMFLDVLFEDDAIVVVNKPPGIVVHPGAGNEEGTLVHGLLAHCPRLALQGAPKRPGIVHRLDQNTSGALVVAKTEGAYLNLIQQFKEHKVRKEYLALVYGRMPQARGEIRTFMDRHPVDRKKMAVVEGKGREAISCWKVKEEWGEISLLRVLIETGRTHQIRVHLSHIHHPVVGDETYGGGKHRARAIKAKPLQQLLLGVDRQMLHARYLAFSHPITCALLSFSAPLPPDFDQLLEKLRQQE